MVFTPTPRSDFFDALAAEIAHNYGRGRAVVAVDGASGTGSFGDDLAAAFARSGRSAFRASIDRFVAPRATRSARGSTSPEGYYSDRYDYSTFMRVLIQPFRMGGSTGFVTAAFDEQRDASVQAKWITGPADALLIVDGPFLQRPELRGSLNFVAYLEAPLDGLAEQVRGAQQLYQAEVQPRTASDAIVSVADEALPKRLFADRC